MDTGSTPIAKLLAVAPLAVLAGYAGLRVIVPEFVPRLIKEDGALEYLQALLYTASACVALLVAMRWPSRTLRLAFVAFGLVCVFIAIEEVSWGGRLLGFEPPEAIRDHNTQDEMSLHNLGPVQRLLHPAYILVGLVAGLGWWMAAKLPDGRVRRELAVALPDRRTALFFLPVAAFYAYLELAGEPTVGWLRSQDQEVFETLLAAGVLAFAWLRWQVSVAPRRRRVHRSEIPG